MLTERQKQWLNTATYDSKTENPVLYKYACMRVHVCMYSVFKGMCADFHAPLVNFRRTVELSKPSRHAKEREEACMEVQSLTDTLTSLPPSGVAQKIQESRKIR